MNLDPAKRVLVVDVSHMAHLFMKATPLSTNHPDTGEHVFTHIPTFLVKNIARWSHYGRDQVIVCFDRAAPARNNYVTENIAPDDGYKMGRAPKHPQIRQGLDLAREILEDGGVSCLYAEGYEADDLVKAAVDSSKLVYPDHNIDVVTGDTDLLPLVDEQTSVFLRSPKRTYATFDDIKKNKYQQITVDNFHTLVSDLSMFKGLEMYYNVVIPAKLLRGDKSDNLKPLAKKLFPPRKFNAFIEYCFEQGVGQFTYDEESYEALFQLLDEWIDDDHELKIDAMLQCRYLYKAMELNAEYPESVYSGHRPPFGLFRFQANGFYPTLSASARRFKITV